MALFGDGKFAEVADNFASNTQNIVQSYNKAVSGLDSLNKPGHGLPNNTTEPEPVQTTSTNTSSGSNGNSNGGGSSPGIMQRIMTTLQTPTGLLGAAGIGFLIWYMNQ